MMRRSRPLVPAVVGTLLLVHAHAVYAEGDGITGFSGRQGDTCNDSCHGGGIAPTVRFEGPSEVAAGSVALFRFVVHSESSRQTVAGFNVAASGGVLAVRPDEDEHLEVDELAHDVPKPNVNGESTWALLWRAPDQPGTYVLYGAGLSANGNGNKNGDDSTTATLVLTVVRPRGDANCDGRLSAADLTTVLQLESASAGNGCDLADADCDGVVGRGDIPTILALQFDAATTPPACGSGGP